MRIDLLRKWTPNFLKPLARTLWRALPRSSARPFVSPIEQDNDRAYAARLKAERQTFDQQTNVHELPEIFHYWSNKYLRPMFEAYGFSNPDQFFAKYLHEAALRTGSDEPFFVSVGAGNCDTEIRVAQLLKAAGLVRFRFECLELSPEMLVRARADAAAQNLSEHFIFSEADFNRWRPIRQYDCVMANQSLHHVLALEHLFDAIKAALHPQGLFITSDMIGRNGHQRWPEALAVVQKFWQELPMSARYNVQLSRQEHQFLDWDCAIDGFEGIRAQDVLPELIKRFHFKLFIAASNVVDPFIDRSFGHHLNAQSEQDRDLVDRLHAYDEHALASGELTPTKLIAVMSLQPETMQSARGLLPEKCVRRA
jgi:SAM-dependent methyltransferase